MRLFFRNKSLYVNEGGHVKYIKLLAKLLPNRKFILQVRLLDDTNPFRLKNLPSNIQLVCVSEFIARNIPRKYNPLVLNDPFKLPQVLKSSKHKQMKEFTIGFIGRVTPTKGLKDISTLLKHLELSDKRINVFFFGSVEDEKQEVSDFVKTCLSFKSLNVEFKGFVDSKTDIYTAINLVIHLNKEEAFPRIALESWAYGVPLIGFNAGGVGEINKLLRANEYLLNPEKDWIKISLCLIEKIKKYYPQKTVLVAQEIIKKRLDVHLFVKHLEKII